MSSVPNDDQLDSKKDKEENQKLSKEELKTREEVENNESKETKGEDGKEEKLLQKRSSSEASLNENKIELAHVPQEDFLVKKEEIIEENDMYILTKDFRIVKPYEYEFRTYVKGRWIGKPLFEMFSSEFLAYSQEYYVDSFENFRW